MTALMCQVTCTLFNIKIDETEWKNHIISTKHLQNCKNVDDKIAIKIFEMIFEVRPEKKNLFNLKNEKTHNFWQLYFSTKLPKEKFDTLCNNSIDKLEKEKNLSTDFDDFISKVTPIIGKKIFGSMKDITFCKICSIAIIKSLLYGHINSNEHKEIEDYFIRKCMTYCDLCCKEIRNDEWREHTISEKHLEFHEKKYCGICNLKFDNHSKHISGEYSSQQRPHIRNENHIDCNHLGSEFHRKNVERFNFYAN